jgi:hypothetical protein
MPVIKKFVYRPRIDTQLRKIKAMARLFAEIVLVLLFLLSMYMNNYVSNWNKELQQQITYHLDTYRSEVHLCYEIYHGCVPKDYRRLKVRK